MRVSLTGLAEAMLKPCSKTKQMGAVRLPARLAAALAELLRVVVARLLGRKP